jgi:prevent-host-death family protein
MAAQCPSAVTSVTTMTTILDVRSGTIGVREAKAQLSRLIADAKNGGEWVITEHGVPVAKLSPLADLDAPLEERISRLESWGWIEPEEAQPAPFVLEPVRADVDMQKLLQEDRGE